MHSLVTYSTFHIPVHGEKIITISTTEDIITFINESSIEEKNNCLILGGWSNVVFTQDFNNTILFNNLLGKDIIKENNTHVIINIASWEERNDIVQWSVDNWYSWIENLIAIPGTIGWAPVQNIGAYGAEVADVILSIEWINLLTGEIVTYTNEQCEFSYRNSIFKEKLKNWFFITNVILQLSKVDNNYHPKIHYGDIETVLLVQGRDGIKRLTPSQVAYAIETIRASKLPDWTKIGTAWSFFKNPLVSKDIYNNLKNQFSDLIGFTVTQDEIKLSAWQLIELVGMKWYRINDAWVYDQHALVLVNYANASGQEVMNLIHLIQSKVQEKFWIDLVPEVNIY